MFFFLESDEDLFVFNYTCLLFKYLDFVKYEKLTCIGEAASGCTLWNTRTDDNKINKNVLCFIYKYNLNDINCCATNRTLRYNKF